MQNLMKVQKACRVFKVLVTIAMVVALSRLPQQSQPSFQCTHSTAMLYSKW